MKKRIKKESVPANARVFANGDICVMKEEYVKGEPMFAYYKPTPKGFTLERTFWKGNAAARYNWAKCNNPEFSLKRPAKKPVTVAA